MKGIAFLQEGKIISSESTRAYVIVEKCVQEGVISLGSVIIALMKKKKYIYKEATL